MRREQVVRGTTKGMKASCVVQLKDTDGRLDPPYYFFRELASGLISSIPPLRGRIRETGVPFRPTTDEELDADYQLLSVTSEGKMVASDTMRGDSMKPKYRYTRVSTGDIVYNPSRVNIGSIGVVPGSLDGSLVSPEYIVFRSETMDPEFLVHLLRSPFYRMYIDVITTGSIRDRLYFRHLETIRVPPWLSRFKKRCENWRSVPKRTPSRYGP